MPPYKGSICFAGHTEKKLPLPEQGEQKLYDITLNDQMLSVCRIADRILDSHAREITLDQSYVKNIDFAVAVYISKSSVEVVAYGHLSVIALDQSRVSSGDFTVAVSIAEDGGGSIAAPSDSHLRAGLGFEVKAGEVELHLDGGACGQTGDLEVGRTVVDRVGLYAVSDNTVVAQTEVVGPRVVDCELELYVGGVKLAESELDLINAVGNL